MFICRLVVQYLSNAASSGTWWNLLTTHKRALFPWWIDRKWLRHPAGVRAAIKPKFYATKAHPVDMAYIKIRPPRQQLERSSLRMLVVFGGD